MTHSQQRKLLHAKVASLNRPREQRVLWARIKGEFCEREQKTFSVSDCELTTENLSIEAVCMDQPRIQTFLGVWYTYGCIYNVVGCLLSAGNSGGLQFGTDVQQRLWFNSKTDRVEAAAFMSACFLWRINTKER